MSLFDAKLLFDSAQTGDRVGARSLVGRDRSLLFSAGSLVVDLVVYHGSDDMCVVHGQVVERTQEKPIEGAHVRLGTGGDAVATDAFGQFHLSAMLPFSQTHLTITAQQGEVRCTIPAGGESGGVAEVDP